MAGLSSYNAYKSIAMIQDETQERQRAMAAILQGGGYVKDNRLTGSDADTIDNRPRVSRPGSTENYRKNRYTSRKDSTLQQTDKFYAACLDLKLNHSLKSTDKRATKALGQISALDNQETSLNITDKPDDAYKNNESVCDLVIEDRKLPDDGELGKSLETEEASMAMK